MEHRLQWLEKNKDDLGWKIKVVPITEEQKQKLISFSNDLQQFESAFKEITKSSADLIKGVSIEAGPVPPRFKGSTQEIL